VGKKIVTSFPHIVRRYFTQLDPTGAAATAIKVVSGSVEAACVLGLADAVVDLVETGTTMRAAGLEVVSNVFESEAVLIRQRAEPKRRGSFPRAVDPTHGGYDILDANKPDVTGHSKEDTIKLIVDRINGFLVALRYVTIAYNCTNDSLQACIDITPGRRAPTITALRKEDWLAVSALVETKKCHRAMDELRLAGAEDVVCSVLANTRM
jgi:ATP phosphoribosyltransferase